MVTKLRMLGIGGKLLSWMCEFLSGGTISAKVAGKVTSLKQALVTGVPPGSVLDPFLCLIYVNSIENSVQCQWKAFVDYFKLYLSFTRSTCVQNNAFTVIWTESA